MLERITVDSEAQNLTRDNQSNQNRCLGDLSGSLRKVRWLRWKNKSGENKSSENGSYNKNQNKER